VNAKDEFGLTAYNWARGENEIRNLIRQYGGKSGGYELISLLSKMFFDTM